MRGPILFLNFFLYLIRYRALPRNFLPDFWVIAIFLLPIFTAGCLPGVREAILRTLPIYIDENVPEAVQEQLLADYRFLQSINGERASPLHRAIFGPVSGANYAGFLMRQITRISYDTEGLCGRSLAIRRSQDGDIITILPNLASAALACTRPRHNVAQMWVTNRFVRSSIPQIARLALILHEGWHLNRDMRYWTHEPCPIPYLGPDGRELRSVFTNVPLSGMPACDVEPRSSYGVTILFLKNIERHCTTCNSRVRMDARIFGNRLLVRIINPEARRQLLEDTAQ